MAPELSESPQSKSALLACPLKPGGRESSNNILSAMSNTLHKYDDYQTEKMIFEDMRSINKSSQAHRLEFIDVDSLSEGKRYSKCHEHEALKKRVETFGKKFHVLEGLINDALKEKPDYVQVNMEELKIDMNIVKVQLARLKFYQLLGLVFLLVSVVLGCLIYKKILEEDYKTFGKIYTGNIPLDM